MSRFVALLRGINVGRARRVAMADLRRLLDELGYADVRTLLNSGNAVFDARSRPRGGHAPRIRRALAQSLGVDTHVIVKSAVEFATAVDYNPLRKLATDPARFLLMFTHEAAELGRLQSLAGRAWAPESLAIGEHAAYLWCPGGILDSRLLQAANRELGELATNRNWATVLKLKALLGCED